jgi:hypothetical protein
MEKDVTYWREVAYLEASAIAENRRSLAVHLNGVDPDTYDLKHGALGESTNAVLSEFQNTYERMKEVYDG